MGIVVGLAIVGAATRNPSESDTQKSEAISRCHQSIKQHLRNPLTARFDDADPSFAHGQWVVNGTVVFANDFGVPKELGFVCTARPTGDEWDVSSGLV